MRNPTRLHRSDTSDNTDRQPPSDAYRRALDDTSETLVRRSRQYVGLVISVLLVIAVSLILAIVAESVAPLVGLTALFPLCAAFFWLDARSVGVWRDRILKAWVNGDLDLPSITETISRIPGLPPATLAAMVASLPTGTPLTLAMQLDATGKTLLVEKICLLHRYARDRLLVIAAVSTFVVLSLTFSTMTRLATPYVIAAVVPTAAIAIAAATHRRLRNHETLVRRAFPDASQAELVTRTIRELWHPRSGA